MIKPLSVKNQSIETSVITKDYKEAICEFVWNGFEANANEVKISYTLEPVHIKRASKIKAKVTIEK